MVALTFDPWQLTDDHDAATKFRSSLVHRARKRTVTLHNDGWLVEGNQSLGDVHSDYLVLLGDDHKYICQCYSNEYGAVRAKKVCSHVLAVILYRQEQRNSEAGCARAQQYVGGRPTTLSLAEASEPAMRPGTSVPDSSAGVDAPLPSDPMFAGKLPQWLTEIRPHQWQAVTEIMAAYSNGAQAVFLDAPTGSGKSAVGAMVAILLKTKALYICSGKSLQDQFVNDFSCAVLKGRANYPTLYGADIDEITAADCTKTPDDPNCQWCGDRWRGCPYNVAKLKATIHELAVLNTSYFLAEGNGTKSAFANKQRGLVIIDECDILESELMGYVELIISDYRLKRLNLTDAKPQFVTKPESWVEWLSGLVRPAVQRELRKITRSTNGGGTVKQIRAVKSLTRLLEGIDMVLPGLASGNWVFDGYNDNNAKAIFRPIRVNEFGDRFLWRHADKFLLMSATIVSPEELVESLGFVGHYETVRVPMTFPIENRRVHVAPVADMAAKKADVEWPKMARAIDRVLELHPDQRVLVHTVSYKLAGYLMANVKSERPLITYRRTIERDGALAQYRQTPGAVLIAPSMDRGVDLRDDDCRVVVVAKIPYPYLGDKQVSGRLHSKGGSQWYQVQTTRSLVQMTGRGVRSAEDWATSYILDAQFVSNVWKRSRGLLPSWWREAIDWSFNTRSLR